MRGDSRLKKKNSATLDWEMAFEHKRINVPDNCLVCRTPDFVLLTAFRGIAGGGSSQQMKVVLRQSKKTISYVLVANRQFCAWFECCAKSKSGTCSRIGHPSCYGCVCRHGRQNRTGHDMVQNRSSGRVWEVSVLSPVTVEWPCTEK